MIDIDILGWTRDWWRDLWPLRARRTQRRLRDFEADARQQAELFGALNRRSIGLRAVEVNRIVGSVGRTAEFDAEFQPTDSTSAAPSRFRRVLVAMRAGQAMPPIELYKLRRWYYVLDGHHRVGAARRLGIETLEAEVTLFVPSGDPDAVRVFHERRAFEQATGLRTIGGTRPSTFRRLLTEIHDYRRELADVHGKEVDLQLAALQWYARVFLPAFAAIRGSAVQTYFPTLRHADMLACLWHEQRIARSRMQAVMLGDSAPIMLPASDGSTDVADPVR